MPFADQVPINNPHSTMLGSKWVVLIAGSTGSALRAVRPPNFHITSDVDAISFTPQARQVLYSVRPWPSWPRPFWRSCWRERSRQPWAISSRALTQALADLPREESRALLISAVVADELPAIIELVTQSQLRMLSACRTASGRIGRWRTRAPQAAKIAFPIAGATTVVAGSPRPTGASLLGISSTSISGTSPMRSGV